MDKIDLIFEKDYIPCIMDVVYCRTSNSEGIEEIQYTLNSDMKLNLFYPIHQYKLIKKPFQYYSFFDEMDAIIYVLSPRDYMHYENCNTNLIFIFLLVMNRWKKEGQKIYLPKCLCIHLFQFIGNNRKNKLKSSIHRFSEIVNSNQYLHSDVFVTFSSVDVFGEFLKTEKFKKYFKRYKGKNCYDQVIKYLQRKISRCVKRKNLLVKGKIVKKKRSIYFSEITSSDNNNSNLKFITKALKEISCKKVLMDSEVW